MFIFLINYNIILRSYQNRAVAIFPTRSFIMEIRSSRKQTQWIWIWTNLPTCIYWRQQSSQNPWNHFHDDQSDYVRIRTGIRRASDEDL